MKARRARSSMKRETAKWVRKAEHDWKAAHKLANEDLPLRDIVCFHCQQAAEKYLKAILQETGLVVPRTHDLQDAIDFLLPGDKTLRNRSARSTCRQASRLDSAFRSKFEFAPARLKNGQVLSAKQ